MITRILNKITFVLFIGILGIFAGCNDEDDIEAIFIGQTWYVGDFYTTTNWKDDNNQEPIYKNENNKNIIRDYGRDRFYITFEDKTFTAKGITNTFSGTWSADGKENTISFAITPGGSSSSGTTAREQQITQAFYNSIENAKFYRGNTIWVKLYPKDKRSFIQLTKNRKEKNQ